MPENTPTYAQRVVHHLLATLAIVVLCLAGLWWGMELWRARLDVPFVYADDSLLMQMLVQNGIEGRWYTWSDRLGAPGAQEMSDYPCADTLDFVLIKLIALFTHDSAVVQNVFYLLTYPLVAWSALIALRSLGLSYPSAVVAGVLYAFLPYHYLRGETHLFLTSYFVVPFVVPPMVWLGDGWVPFFRRDEQRLRFELWQGRGWLAVLAMVVLGAGNPYYGFFAMFLLGVAGLAAWVREGRAGFGSFAGAVGLSAVIVASVAVNMLPTLIYNAQAGSNTAARPRHPGEAELYGLRMIQFLMPVRGHNIPAFREQTEYFYNHCFLTALNNENMSSSLGLIGTVGFFVLLASVLGARRPDFPPVMSRLAELNLGAVLLATVGGIGALINHWYPQFRTYNRISVFVGFFCLAAVFWLVDRLWRSAEATWRDRLMPGMLLAVLLVFGIYDQVTPGWRYYRLDTDADDRVRVAPIEGPLPEGAKVTDKIPGMLSHYAETRERWEADKIFVRAIEAALPEGAMVANLPTLEFPETPPLDDFGPYRQMYGYLHSKRLRWSMGAVKGRPVSARQLEWTKMDTGLEWKWVEGESGPQPLLAELRNLGFVAVVVDWDAFYNGHFTDEDEGEPRRKKRDAARVKLRADLIAVLGEPIAERPRPAGQKPADLPWSSCFRLSQAGQ